MVRVPARPLRALLALVLASQMILSAAAWAGSGGVRGPGAAEASDRYVVGFHGSPALQPGDRLHGATVERVDPTLAWASVVGADAGFPARAAQDDRVRYVAPDPLLPLLHLTPNDPMYPTMYGPQQIGAPAAWDKTLGSTGVVLCTGDTGVRSSHEDLAGRYAGGFDFINSDPDPADDHGHGTHVTGTATATTNNAIGIAGIAQTSYKHVKVLNSGGSGSWSQVASGVTWCADNGAHVVSLSLGGSGGSPVLQDAVNYAWNSGVLVVASAGNSGPCGGAGCVGYPAKYENAMAVACTNETKALCSFSSQGPEVDIAAPGNNVVSTCRANDAAYCSMSGTSMSAPHVAGAAALLKANNTTLSNVQIRALLEASAEDLGAPGLDSSFGNGLVRADDALAFVPPPPGAPGKPQLKANPGNAKVKLDWSMPSDGGNPITAFHLYRGTCSGCGSLHAVLGNATLSYLDTGLTNGQAYYYQVAAVNSVAEGPRSNEAQAVPFVPPLPPIVEDFEGTLTPDWVLTGLWHIGSACATAPSPSRYLAYNQETSCTYDVGASSGTATFIVDLSAPGTAALEFTHRFNVESYDCCYDIMQVQVSVDGGSSYATLKQWDSTNNTLGAWTPAAFDLSGFIGNVVRVRFSFDSVDGLYNNFLGWLIDDVRVAYDLAPPSEPLNLVAASGPGLGVVTLSWDPPADPGDAPVTGYRVYRSSPLQPSTVVAEVSGTGYVDSGVLPLVPYTYVVTAVNLGGEGPGSAPATALGGVL